MKEIMHTYGALIISAAVLVVILLLFSNVAYTAAAAFENKDILNDSMQNISYDNYHNVHIPDIQPKSAIYETSRDIAVSSLMQDGAYTGNISKVQAYAVFDESGNRADGFIKSNGQRLNIANPGIYGVYIKITLVNGMQRHYTTKIAVNQRI